MLQASFVQNTQMRVDSCSQMLHANGTSLSPVWRVEPDREMAGVKSTAGSAALPGRPRETPVPFRWRAPEHTAADGPDWPDSQPQRRSADPPWAGSDTFAVHRRASPAYSRERGYGTAIRACP